ncbi:MAG: Hsp20/alpha crystallin family protein [Thermoanaerobacteraceae bacterium]
MSLIKRNDNDNWPFDVNFKNFPNIFDISLPSFAGFLSKPRIDITESETEIIATAELPGVDKKDIEINLHENLLEIKGQTAVEEEKDNKNYYIKERYYGSFDRKISLPAEIDPDKTTAKFENGLLKITMPKLHPTKPKGKKIDIE